MAEIATIARPYAEALFRYLVRNKYNQNMGRKIKITFEGCDEDHSALRIHDIGFWAVNQMVNGEERRGFRVYLGGGLGTTPQLAQLYKEFLPAEEIFNLTASIVRLFDRYGERKARMKARMKFLIQSMGWDAFVVALEEERKEAAAGIRPGRDTRSGRAANSRRARIRCSSYRRRVTGSRCPASRR